MSDAAIDRSARWLREMAHCKLQTGCGDAGVARDATCLARRGLELALQLVQREPDRASYSLLLGDAYRASGKPKEARGARQKAVRQGSALAPEAALDHRASEFEM